MLKAGNTTGRGKMAINATIATVTLATKNRIAKREFSPSVLWGEIFGRRLLGALGPTADRISPTSQPTWLPEGPGLMSW